MSPHAALPSPSRRYAGCGIPPRRRLPTTRCRPRASGASAPESVQDRVDRLVEQFSGKRVLSPIGRVALSVSTPVFYAASAAVAAMAAAGGYQAGSKAPLTGQLKTAAPIAAAVASTGLVAAGAVAVRKQTGDAAAAELWNALCDQVDPASLPPDAFQVVKQRADESSEVMDSVATVYAAYLQSVIPPGATPLQGDEHLVLRQFLDATGIADEAAATMHIMVGRNLFRDRLEVSDSEQQVRGVKTFQKLIYVSWKLFGTMRSGFLTPWHGRFPNVTPEQVLLARRDCARSLVSAAIERDHGGVVPTSPERLAALREVQLDAGLSDDACRTLVNGLLCDRTAEKVAAAVDCITGLGATPDIKGMMSEVDGLVAESLAFSRLASDPSAADGLLPGVGAMSIGFASASDPKLSIGKRVDLYSRFMRAKISECEGAISKELTAELEHLSDVLSIPSTRATEARTTVVTETYQKLLEEAVTSGAMDAAESPASVLNELLTKVGLPGPVALALHEGMYRSKLLDCLDDAKIDEEDAAALERTQRLLCLSADAVTRVNSELKGALLRDKLIEMLRVQVDQFGVEDVKEVAALQRDLRVEDDEAMTVLKTVGQSELVKRLETARTKGNKLQSAREMKKAVEFSQTILTPLILGMKGDVSKAETMEELRKQLDAAKVSAAAEEEGGDAKGAEGEEAEGKEAKAAAAASATPGAQGSMVSQRDVNVGDAFAPDDRKSMYRVFLEYCMTGEVVEVPMGGMIVLERSPQEFERLRLLGDLLNLNPFDIQQVQVSMSEEVYKSQIEGLCPGGVVTDDARKQLEELAEKLALPPEKATRMVRQFENKKLLSGMGGSMGKGDLTLHKMLELGKDVGVDSVIGSESGRMKLYEKFVDDVLAGRAEQPVDAEQLLQTLPEQAHVDVGKAAEYAKQVATSKSRPSLVQAVALMRQKEAKECVSYLNNFLLATQVGELKEVKWSSPQELREAFELYCKYEGDGSKRTDLAAAFGIADGLRDQIASAVDAGDDTPESKQGAAVKTRRSVF